MRDNSGRFFSRFARLAMVIAVAGAPFLLACAKKEKADEKSNVPTPTKEIVATGPMEKLPAPAGVIAFGGTESAEAGMKALAAILGRAGAMMSPAVAAGGLQQALGLQADVVDLAKPMRIAIIDPKSFPEPRLLAFSMKAGREAFVKALPADHKKDDGGNAYSYSNRGKTNYVSFIDEFAIVTGHKDVFAKNRDFIRQLLGSKASGQAALLVAMKNVTATFGKEMDGLVEQAAAAPRGGIGNPEQMKAALQGMMGIARELDTLVITATVPDNGLVLTLDGRAQPDTALAKIATGSSPGKLALLPKLPKDAAFAAVFSMDADRLSPLMSQMMQWSMKLSSPTGNDKLASISESFLKACTGEFGFVGYRHSGSDNLTMVSLTGVRDAAAVKKGWDELVKLYQESSFVDALKKKGVEITAKPDAYKVGAVSVNALDYKFGAAGAGPAAERMRKMMGALSSSHSAVKDDLAVVAMGKDAKTALTAWLEGKVDGGLDQAPAIARAKSRAADNASVLAWGSIASMIAAMPVPGADRLPAMQGGNGLALSVGAKDGSLRIVLDLSAEEIQQLVAAASALKGRR
jgi:hypothetical protein